MTDPHDHDGQVAAYGRCVTCTAAAGPPTATEARDDALARVEAGSPLSWLIEARAVIKRLAHTHDEFTSDDCWARLAHPPEPRALGAVMRQAAVDGTIRNTGRVRPSTRPDCHARPVAIWTARPVDDPVGSVGRRTTGSTR